MIKSTNYRISFAIILTLFAAQPVFSQAALEPWGNLTGIRVEGELMEFETNISVVDKGWSKTRSTALERQRPKYVRKGLQQVVSASIDSLYFTEVVEDAGTGKAKVRVEVSAKADVDMEGVFFSVKLPREYYKEASIQVNNLKAVKMAEQAGLEKYLTVPASSLRVTSPKRQLLLTFESPRVIVFKQSPDKKDSGQFRLYIPVKAGSMKSGESIAQSLLMTATGQVDKGPVTLVLNTGLTGRVFDGFGGNFRLQNPRTDPQVIDYCLENIKVKWGRVEMPWRFWQPAIDTNPILEAKAGRLNPFVEKSMLMAQRLHKLGMPVILSAWSAPSWAIVGAPKFRPGPDGVWGNPLDKARTNEIYRSIGDYVQYLKDQYGVEISMFSFNESDLGINIRQTGEEHAELIRGLGAHFASRGLKTKMLLGDNSDATTYEFIYPAMNDTSTHPYIGAISFHSWRGWETETLKKWADVAAKMKLPLLVGEGSVDAASWAYPAIFQEQIYALKEINLYTRLMAICQPASILQWQLTADYSPLAGGGIFGDTGALRPTQRFWNLKQFASVPGGLPSLAIQTAGSNISCAALGDTSKSMYAVHLVNNGATRTATLRGLPRTVKSLRMWVTDTRRNMEEQTEIPVINGNAKFPLQATSFTTLVSP